MPLNIDVQQYWINYALQYITLFSMIHNIHTPHYHMLFQNVITKLHTYRLQLLSAKSYHGAKKQSQFLRFSFFFLIAICEFSNAQMES